MKELAALLNQMRAAGVIQDYALFGAVAQMRYTEPVATLDADVLVAIPENRLDALARVYEFCEARGYRPEGEAILVGAWPTQFIPVFSPLTGEALLQAEIADFEGIPLRVVKPEYLAVIALSTGRAKDFARVLALLESGSVRQDTIEPLAARHGLSDAWRRFESRFLSD